MSRAITSIAFALIWFSVAPCAGEAEMDGSVGGNALHEQCEAELLDPLFGFCFGYILGAEEMMQVMNAKSLSPTYCRPDKATAGQIHDVVVKYVRDHPEQRHELALFLVLEALTTAFPCD